MTYADFKIFKRSVTCPRYLRGGCVWSKPPLGQDCGFPLLGEDPNTGNFHWCSTPDRLDYFLMLAEYNKGEKK
jgi:hypothetical protein